MLKIKGYNYKTGVEYYTPFWIKAVTAIVAMAVGSMLGLYLGLYMFMWLVRAGY